MKKQEVILEKISVTLLVVSGLLGLIITILDFVGTDFENGPWSWIKGPQDIILLIVSVLAIGLGLERYVRLKQDVEFKNLAQNLAEIPDLQIQAAYMVINSLSGVAVRQFKNEIDLMKYINQIISKAKIQVDEVSWGTKHIRNYRFDTQKKVYDEYMRRAESASQRIPYREVFVFDRESRLTRFQQRLEAQTTGYSCRYLEELTAPLIEFMVFDREEVVIFSNKHKLFFSVKHPLIGKLFSNYYEEVWDIAFKLKDGNTCYWENIRKVLGDEITEQIKF